MQPDGICSQEGLATETQESAEADMAHQAGDAQASTTTTSDENTLEGHYEPEMDTENTPSLCASKTFT